MTYPKTILSQNSENRFNYSEPAAHILSLLSGVDKILILKTTIYSRNILRFLPWYRAVKGGGAITLGSEGKASITFTENFFSSDGNRYHSHAYAHNSHHWLRLSAHEVCHLEHVQRFKYLIIYLLVFALQYWFFGHAKAPLEIEAQRGTHQYDKFVGFGHQHLKADIINEVFENSSTDLERIQKIDEYWKLFLEFKCMNEGLEEEV